MQRRLAPKSADRRIGWPRPWCAAPAFDRRQQRCFFAADKRARAEPDLDIEVERCAADVVAKQSTPPRFANRRGQPRYGHRILGAHVDESLIRAHGVSGNRHAFNHAMRIAFHDAAIHERAGVAFVAIADHILHVAAGFGYGAPLQAGRISAAASTSNPLSVMRWRTPLGVISTSAVISAL